MARAFVQRRSGVSGGQHTVVTYDRRGFPRSKLDGPRDYEHRLDTDADDVRRLIEYVSDEPATVFGSSSGGIVALTALAHHASVIRTRVALEPPVVKQLADGQKWLDFFSGLYDLYRRSGVEPALQEFREQTFAESDRQVLGRAMDLGDPAQMLANATYWFEHKLRQYPARELDLDALQARATRTALPVWRASRV